MSDSVQSHRWQPTRLPHSWDSPGKNTGVGCHFLLQCMKVKNERSHSVMSNSQRPDGLQPTRLLRPWDFPDEYWSGVPLPFPLMQPNLSNFLLSLVLLILQIRNHCLFQDHKDLFLHFFLQIFWVYAFSSYIQICDPF